MIEREFEQRGCDIDTAFKQGNLLLVECLLDDLGGDTGGRRAEVRQLHDAAIARGDGCGERSHREPERKIPGAQDEAHAARLMDDPRLVVLVSRGNHFDGLHPLVEIVDVRLDVADDAEDLGHLDFAFRLASVLFHGRHDFIGVSLHGRFQLPQLFFPFLGGGGFHLPLMRLLESENPL